MIFVAQRFSSAAGRRTAGEHGTAARRVARTGGVKWSADRQALDVGQPGVVRRIDVAPQERLQTVAALGSGLLDERGRNLVRPSRDRHANPQPRVQRFGDFLGVFRQDREVSGTTHRHEMDARPIDRDLELLRIFEAAYRAEIGLEQLHLDDVLTIERKRRTSEQPPARSEWQAFHMVALRRVPGDMVGVGVRQDAGIANGQRTDFVGGREVTFHQRRRHAQHVRDVIEAGTRIVGRQQRRCVDVERQQVANDVRVFRAIEPMQERTARIGIRRFGTIERCFQKGRQRVVCGRVRTGPTRGRHRPTSQLPDDLFPDVGLRWHVGQLQGVQAQSRGLQPLVMADHAVLIEEGTKIRRSRRSDRRRSDRRAASPDHGPSSGAETADGGANRNDASAHRLSSIHVFPPAVPGTVDIVTMYQSAR